MDGKIIRLRRQARLFLNRRVVVVLCDGRVFTGRLVIVRRNFIIIRVRRRNVFIRIRIPFIDIKDIDLA
ncbi:hypothetical protein SAMN04488542_12018 [Fontibacillus panacisegetis]|uniref:Uncharacterized protein n=1 Tax=Fontibacillus panacisegetis TaxID=670482 RepID=A0A1G7PZ54_9BACL|nr:hypothetical protein [Fontibacillus panacisegetis]SDF90650.1 hypothetical protein SAMN04488542_12018 [Fontibacillus panacisegetis]